jgi:hypothetical protein
MVVGLTLALASVTVASPRAWATALTAARTVSTAGWSCGIATDPVMRANTALARARKQQTRAAPSLFALGVIGSP